MINDCVRICNWLLIIVLEFVIDSKKAKFPPIIKHTFYQSLKWLEKVRQKRGDGIIKLPIRSFEYFDSSCTISIYEWQIDHTKQDIDVHCSIITIILVNAHLYSLLY